MGNDEYKRGIAGLNAELEAVEKLLAVATCPEDTDLRIGGHGEFYCEWCDKRDKLVGHLLDERGNLLDT